MLKEVRPAAVIQRNQLSIEDARTRKLARKPTCSVMSDPRRAAHAQRPLGRDDRSEPIPLHFVRKSPRVGSRPERTSIGSGRALYDGTAVR